MVKYAQTRPVYEKPPSIIGQAIERGLVEGQAIRQRQNAEATLNNPNASPMQKAIAASSINPALAKDILKQSQQEAQLADIRSRYAPRGSPSKVEQQLAELQAYQPNARIPNQPEMIQQMVPQQVQSQAQTTPPMSPVPAKLPFAEGEILETSVLNPQLGARMSDINKMAQKESLENRREEREIRKETQPYVNKILDTQKAIRVDESVLNDMEALSKTGKLTTPLTANLLNKIGLPLGILNNPESEEFDKLSNQLTRTIQNYYGARILQTEFHNFLKQIPTLQNSEEGRKRIIDNLRRANEPSKLEYEAYKQVMQEHGGKRPVDIKEKVTERLLPELDTWLKDMKSSLNKTLPNQVPEGTLVIVAPDGSKFAIPKDQVAQALSQGGRLE